MQNKGNMAGALLKIEYARAKENNEKAQKNGVGILFLKNYYPSYQLSHVLFPINTKWNPGLYQDRLYERRPL